MNGGELLLGAIAGFVTALLLRRGREKEAELRGIAIGRRKMWSSLVGDVAHPPSPGRPGPADPPRPPRHRPVS